MASSGHPLLNMHSNLNIRPQIRVDGTPTTHMELMRTQKNRQPTQKGTRCISA